MSIICLQGGFGMPTVSKGVHTIHVSLPVAWFIKYVIPIIEMLLMNKFVRISIAAKWPHGISLLIPFAKITEETINGRLILQFEDGK